MDVTVNKRRLAESGNGNDKKDVEFVSLRTVSVAKPGNKGHGTQTSVS